VDMADRRSSPIVSVGRGNGALGRDGVGNHYSRALRSPFPVNRSFICRAR